MPSFWLHRVSLPAVLVVAVAFGWAWAVPVAAGEILVTPAAVSLEGRGCSSW